MGSGHATRLSQYPEILETVFRLVGRLGGVSGQTRQFFGRGISAREPPGNPGRLPVDGAVVAGGANGLGGRSALGGPRMDVPTGRAGPFYHFPPPDRPFGSDGPSASSAQSSATYQPERTHLAPPALAQGRQQISPTGRPLLISLFSVTREPNVATRLSPGRREAGNCLWHRRVRGICLGQGTGALFPRHGHMVALHSANLTVSTGSNYHHWWGSGQFLPPTS